MDAISDATTFVAKNMFSVVNQDDREGAETRVPRKDSGDAQVAAIRRNSADIIAFTERSQQLGQVTRRLVSQGHICCIEYIYLCKHLFLFFHLVEWWLGRGESVSYIFSGVGQLPCCFIRHGFAVFTFRVRNNDLNMILRRPQPFSLKNYVAAELEV